MHKKEIEESDDVSTSRNKRKNTSSIEKNQSVNKKPKQIKEEHTDVNLDKEDEKSRNKKKQPKGKGVFECGICGKKFAYKENLKVHIDAVHMVRKYSCQYCDKTYSRLQTLKGHIKVYHEGLHFKCSKPNCNESFQRKNQLKAHMMSHQGKYLFICSTCSKGYNHKSDYEAHCNTHLVNKPYKCGQCNAY